MKYTSITELNLRDAARHLAEARQSGDPDRGAAATADLGTQLELIKNLEPKLYEEYIRLIIGEGDHCD